LHCKIFMVLSRMKLSWQMEHFSKFDTSCGVIFVSRILKNAYSWCVILFFGLFNGFCGSNILTFVVLNRRSSFCARFRSEDCNRWLNNISFCELCGTLPSSLVSKMSSSESTKTDKSISCVCCVIIRSLYDKILLN
jgi:hypothetical protein